MGATSPQQFFQDYARHVLAGQWKGEEEPRPVADNVLRHLQDYGTSLVGAYEAERVIEHARWALSNPW